MADSPTPNRQVPTASPVDSARALSQVLLPVVARGAITRRPRVVRRVQQVGGDARAVAVMQRLRDTYGPGPVQVKVPGRRLTLLLEPEQVHRVLGETPVPFRADTREKRAALAHFQPEGVLASTPEQREVRRPFNEQVLQTGRTLHEIADPAAAVVSEETAVLLEQLRHDSDLDWPRFSQTWWRIVRRIVLGDSARDDDRLTDRLLQLRQDANWSFLRRQRTELRERFLDGVRSRLGAAEEGSLAGVVRRTPAAPGTEPHQQVPQWLFAFDAAAWATFRALALLGTHPDASERVRAELSSAPDLPYARSCVLESLRLWPTTPAILRDSTENTEWAGGVLPAGASIMIFAPFFHRDETRLPEAHSFAPQLWLGDRSAADWPLVPFSGGTAMCPGRDVTLMVASQVLARLVEPGDRELLRGGLQADRPVPGTLDPFSLRFAA